jgi:hypothetical protein
MGLQYETTRKPDVKMKRSTSPMPAFREKVDCGSAIVVASRRSPSLQPILAADSDS